MKILAIDFGLKRIGFALGSRLLKTASPIDPLIRKNSKQVIQHIQQLIPEYDITEVLLGYPLNMDGTPGAMTQHVEHFHNRLRKALEPDIQVRLMDERLSSFEAGRQLTDFNRESGRSGKRKERLDSMSAAVLLQRYFQNSGTETGDLSDRLLSPTEPLENTINGKEKNI